ncbi:MobQ family relaxase [Xanthomonas oryzae]|uniref:MobQ family relaxase n=1 Tax=Xanthomonas oryzae TaxID=347 RepID=UPI001EE7B252|nr:MobQ family relaxase [Xanthomonas oryzae]
MGENCQKPVPTVTKTGNSSTPKTRVKPCNGYGLGVFQGRLNSISRAKGYSATAAAAYRAGIRIEDDRLGVIQDYTKRSGVASFEILAPTGSPAWVFDPSRLWNAAETAETRSNARVAREMEIALPCELTDLQREALARDIGRQLVDRYNSAVQIAIHTPDKHGDQRNHHAHILFTSRQVGPGGLTDYAAKVFDDFKQGPREVLYWRETVASTTNEHLKNAGHNVRVDHRTLDSISKCNTLSAVRVCTCQKAINTSVRKSAQCSRSRRGAVKVCARFPGF